MANSDERDRMVWQHGYLLGRLDERKVWQSRPWWSRLWSRRRTAETTSEGR